MANLRFDLFFLALNCLHAHSHYAKIILKHFSLKLCNYYKNIFKFDIKKNYLRRNCFWKLPLVREDD